MKSLFQILALALIVLACGNTVMASELYKVVQAVKKSVSSGTGSKLRIAIIGGGYSGLACGHFCSKVADTVSIFGLEDSPGEQKGTSASTISAGLLHPLTPRGRVIYRGEEAFADSLALLNLAQRHSKDEIFQRYPFEDTVDGHGAFGDLANGVTVPLQDASSSSPLSPNVETAVRRTPMTAMLRPLLRESDFAHWQKAAGSNAKWVSLLNEEQLGDFNLLREGSESGTADTSSDASAFQPDQQQLLLGVAVIKNAIVVNSAAYLKGLWSSMSEAPSTYLGEEEKKEGKDMSGGMTEDPGPAVHTATVTYEKRAISHEEVKQLAADFDIVILAAGAGIQPLWAEDDALPLPFSYVRGQNVELIREEGKEQEHGGSSRASLQSVLLSGEYIIPKTTKHNQGQGKGQSEGSDSAAIRTSHLLIGGTHEHALTMAELEAPADMEVASSLLMDKMRTMYPALDKEGWRPSRCIAGIRVVPARTNLGRLPAAGRHPQMRNVWLMGGLGSRGLLYHALLAQLLVEAATAADTESGLGTGVSAG